MTIKNILLTADLTPESQPVIAYVFEFAEKLGALVHILHADTVPLSRAPTAVGDDAVAALQGSAREQLSLALEQHGASPSMGKILVDRREPTEAVHATVLALHIDLIVVGTHAARGMQRILVGSTANEVLEDALVPVLVIKVPRLRDRR